MRVLRRLPAVLAALLLGAHFLRAGQLSLMTACLILAVLPFVPWSPATWITRLALVAGTGSWALTAWRIAAARQAAELPYTRMIWILGSVAAFTLLAAILLPDGSGTSASGDGVRRRHSPEPAAPGTES